MADRVQAKEVKLAYCPTGDILADFFTKPLQGSLFKCLHDDIMNVAPATHDLPGPRSVLGNMESSNIDGQTGVNHEINVSCNLKE